MLLCSFLVIVHFFTKKHENLKQLLALISLTVAGLFIARKVDDVKNGIDLRVNGLTNFKPGGTLFNPSLSFEISIVITNTTKAEINLKGVTVSAFQQNLTDQSLSRAGSSVPLNIEIPALQKVLVSPVFTLSGAALLNIANTNTLIKTTCYLQGVPNQISFPEYVVTADVMKQNIEKVKTGSKTILALIINLFSKK